MSSESVKLVRQQTFLLPVKGLLVQTDFKPGRLKLFAVQVLVPFEFAANLHSSTSLFFSSTVNNVTSSLIPNPQDFIQKGKLKKNRE